MKEEMTLRWIGREARGKPHSGNVRKTERGTSSKWTNEMEKEMVNRVQDEDRTPLGS